MRSMLVSLCMFVASLVSLADTRELPLDVYSQKVYGAWLGQCVGNMYGLAHECRYVDEPYSLVDQPTHYAPYIIRIMQNSNGAFSDDDTDIEYMDLFTMEKHGPEPTYADLTDAWMRHVWHHVWVANRSARHLMAYGYQAPVTGMKGYNDNWFQIDPQLVNEIWAVIAPGMVQYAAKKSDWGARVTNDDYGTHPTIWYGAMYAAAFFESDVNQLYDIGMREVPQGRFADALVLCKLLYAAHPNDWKASRRVIRDMYYTNEPKETKSVVAAQLNGAMGALALLYGQGDFHTTLNMACMLGMDADNQAATLSGLMGVIHGPEGIPRSLLFPPEFPEWKEPLNDTYYNRTRDYLPSGTITDIAARTVEMGKQQIVLAGGRIEGAKLIVNVSAEFTAPLEARLLRPLTFDLEQTVDVPIIGVGGKGRVHVTKIAGQIPPGLSVQVDRLVGKTTKPGLFNLQVGLKDEGDHAATATCTLPLRVLGDNLAVSAVPIAAVTAPTGGGAKALSVLINRTRRGVGQSYDSFDGENTADEDWYGLVWREPQRLARLRYFQGEIFRDGGTWETLTVQYLDGSGAWRDAEDVEMSPVYLFGGKQELYSAFWPYTFTFKPVETRGIRIYGKPAGSAQFTSIAELEAYAE